MKRASLSAILAVFSVSAAFAQQTVSTAGDNATGSGGSSSYTIGQVDYTHVAGGSGAVYQGVQQPFEIFTVGIHPTGQTRMELTVFPNPVSSFVVLRTEGLGSGALYYQLTDLYGRVLLNERISQKETVIRMQDFRPSTYLLRVSGESEMQLFKVVKHQ